MYPETAPHVTVHVPVGTEEIESDPVPVCDLQLLNVHGAEACEGEMFILPVFETQFTPEIVYPDGHVYNWYVIPKSPGTKHPGSAALVAIFPPPKKSYHIPYPGIVVHDINPVLVQYASPKAEVESIIE
ncbi:MAG: hypothetical protein WAZ40_02135 [Minisyncoccia bacterium]